MKERPILFSGPMVRAILEGRKTQTRRIVKPQDIDVSDGVPFLLPYASGVPEPVQVVCPYGKPGDRLWVRETHAIWHRYATTIDDPELPIETGAHYKATHDESKAIAGRWRPSIHMPRWACRIVLEVVSVRVERLNDCSSYDALAEGVGTDVVPMAQKLYSDLWESINGAGSWDANPWVWVVEFRRVSDRSGILFPKEKDTAESATV